MDLITKDSKQGTGNSTYTANAGDKLQQVELWNDGTASLTYVCDGKTFQVPAGEVSSEIFVSFQTVTITATGAWRLIVRGR